MEDIRVEEGGIWEEKYWFIAPYQKKSEYHHICKHLTTENEIPIVICGINEGGYNSTGICYDCIVEAVEKFKKVHQRNE